MLCRSCVRILPVQVINVFDKDKRHQLMKEMRTLHTASCPNLVSFYGAFFKEGQISIGLELMDAGSLHDIIEACGASFGSAVSLGFVGFCV